MGIPAQGLDILVAGVDQSLASRDQRERVRVHRIVVLESLVHDLLAEREYDVAKVARLGVRGQRCDPGRSGRGTQLDRRGGKHVLGTLLVRAGPGPWSAAPVEQRDAD